MVRYRPETRERGYTFRLVNGGDANGISPTGTLMSDHSVSTMDSSVYKERIDSLFRQEQLQRHNANLANRKPLVEEEDDAAVNEPTMEHLQLHFQKVLAEQRGAGSVASSKLQSTTYIQVNNHVKAGEANNRESAESRAQRFNEARNAVQAKIEKMFQDASGNQQQTKAIVHHTSDTINISNNKAVISVRSEHPPPPPPAKAHGKQNVPLPPIPVSAPPPPAAEPTNTNQYKVDYLGSLSLPGRATSLESLQFPLKELYSKYRQQANGKYHGTLEISPAGLRIKYQSSNRRAQEILNPFPTIAVWAAVKFVARSESGGRRFAFLPLICDPENQDKQSLFHALDDEGDWVTVPAFHPPLFTCVMRNTQAPKNLECHAFVCENPEDAIVIAANLYQALLRNMKNNDGPKGDEAQRLGQKEPNKEEHAKPALAKKPPSPEISQQQPAVRESQQQQQQQPIYSPSSISNWSESSVSSCVQTPVRPPRRKKSSKLHHDGGLERRKSVRRSQNKNRASQGKANLRRSMRTASQRSNGRVKRSVSERQLGEMLASADVVVDNSAEHNGDILTKVAIPRSKSFMTVPQQNYSIAELFEELKVGALFAHSFLTRV